MDGFSSMVTTWNVKYFIPQQNISKCNYATQVAQYFPLHIIKNNLFDNTL